MLPRFFTYLIFSLLILISGMSRVRVHAADVGCTLPTMTVPTASEIQLESRYAQCAAAQRGGNPRGITEFVCPSHEMWESSLRTIGPGGLAHGIYVNLALNRVDAQIMTYMSCLKQTRAKPDSLEWTESGWQVLSGPIASTYRGICSFSNGMIALNPTTDVSYTRTISDAPRTDECNTLIAKKLLGWQYLYNILMAESIAKNAQNSKDKWITGVKGSYSRIIDLWHDYQKILMRSVSKMNGYNKQVVQ